MEGKTRLFHGVPAVLKDGKWIVLSAGFNEIVTIPETLIDDPEIFQELNTSDFFDYSVTPISTFQLTLITTSDCNLRCRYCFASSGEKAQVMSDELAFASIDHALSMAKGRRLSVAFFGGEPSLTANLIKRVVEYTKQRLEAFPEVNGAEFSVTTNGVMSEDFLELLISSDFQITLSADGCSEVQDFQRPLKMGGGSSRFVEKTTKRLAKEKKPFKIRVTVTDFSVSRMVETVDWLYSLGGKAIHFEPVTIAGRASVKTKGRALDKPTAAEFVENLQKAILRGNELGVGIVNSSFMNISTPPPEFCEGNSNNRISISYTGDATTCVEVQEKCHPASGSFTIGRFDQQTKSIIMEHEQRLRSCSGTKMTECSSCFAVRSCGGGCPVRNFHVTGNTAEVDPYRCEMIKQMLPFLMGIFLETSMKAVKS